MPKLPEKIYRVALSVPLRRLFDYLPGSEESLEPGSRVLVPFGRKSTRIGIIVDIANKSDLPLKKLKSIIRVLDEAPVVSTHHLKLMRWASQYYQYPIGEAVLNCLPSLIKQGKPAELSTSYQWKLTAGHIDNQSKISERAILQRKVYEYMLASDNSISPEVIKKNGWLAAIKALHTKGLVDKINLDTEIKTGNIHQLHELNPAQKKTVHAIVKDLDDFFVHLVYGLTGSGKTEIYINIINYIINKGKQALVLVPEIGLTPQLIDRFSSIDTDIVVLHSGLTSKERLNAWLKSRDGKTQIIIGTRSAVWTPLFNPGVIIIDEEHDLSYKQQDKFRYSARNVAIMRANMDKIPVILGSATPSMESIHNVNLNKFSLHKLDYRATSTPPPVMQTINLCNQNMTGALSPQLIHAIKEEIENKKQVLLFLNKRGYSPVLMCHSCGWVCICERCDKQKTFHKSSRTTTCHHCSSQSQAPDQCPQCNHTKLELIGHGTERLTETVESLFPDANIIRIDRDSTRRKGSLDKMFQHIHESNVDIIIGTQMLAKGHHFPDLNLVGIIDADRGLFSTDYRASEHMAQLIIQVSGRAGRTSENGRVLIQTHYPDHPLLKCLVESGYDEFTEQLLEERKVTELPPFSYQALLRSEDYKDSTNLKFLNESKGLIQNKHQGIEVYGPFLAPMEKKAGRKRYQLLIQSKNRSRLGNVLSDWSREVESLKTAKSVRWSLDIDPLDML